VEREETLNTPLWGGFWQDTDVQRDLFHRRSKHSSSSRGEYQHSGPGRSGEGWKEPKAYHLRTHRQPRRSTPTTHAMPHHQELATAAAAAAVGGWVGSRGDERDGGESAKWGHHAAPRHQHPGARSPEPGAWSPEEDI